MQRVPVFKAKIGVGIVRARGEYRTKLPDHVWKVYSALNVLTQGSPPEGGRCFLCRKWSSFMCPCCGLFSHAECCEGLACYSFRKSIGDEAFSKLDGDPNFEEVSNCLALAYMASSSDSNGDKVASLTAFDRTSESSQGSSPCDLLIVNSACDLCHRVLSSEVLCTDPSKPEGPC